MTGQYATVSTAECAPLPEDVSSREGADAALDHMEALIGTMRE